jgi:hypothetical protein
MKKTIRGAMPILLILLTLPISAEENRSHIGVMPVINATGQDYFEEAARLTTENIELILKLTGKYRVTRHTTITDPYSEFRIIEKQAAAYGYDFILYGRISSAGGPPWVIELALWSRKDNKIIDTVKKEIPRIMEIFNASDELTQSLIGNFSGIHIAFGKLLFQPQGNGQAPYNVFIDGSWVGSGIKELQVLYGKRSIVIVQNVGGRDMEIFNRILEISEDSTETIQFTLKEASLTEGVFDYQGEVPSRHTVFTSKYLVKGTK